MAAQEFWNMWEPKTSTLKGGYTSLVELVFQSVMKEICVHVEDWWLTQREAIQLVKDFTLKHAQDEVELYMGMVAEEDQSFKSLLKYLCGAFQSGETLSVLINDFYSWL